MLIKNEAEHLERSLPKWAKIIDYWIIGVDDQNTDSSPEIIQKYLGHIPGEIVIVEFDGMGPTWTKLVEVGIEKYPEATHGIIADADFMPLHDTLDKWQLDIRCSKHMFTIWTEDLQNSRRMDWIYRNIPGAQVKRRVHQAVEVPELPNQEVFQTLIDLNVKEHTGGYQDRTEGKMLRYIKWLEKDLEEMPGDGRTLYYLGYSHFDIFLNNRHNPSEKHWDHLRQSVIWYKKRVAITEGYYEERWFAILKLAEIFERSYNNWPEALKYYEMCVESDPERADPLFYIGQHYRLHGQPEKALEPLARASKLSIPERSLFNWHFLYQCITKLEYARAVHAIQDPSLESLKAARDFLISSQCHTGTPAEKDEADSLLETVNALIQKKRGTDIGKKRLLTRFVNFHENYGNRLADFLDQHAATRLAETIETIRSKLAQFGSDVSCADFRRASRPYSRWWKDNSQHVSELLNEAPKLLKRLTDLSELIGRTCR